MQPSRSQITIGKLSCLLLIACVATCGCEKSDNVTEYVVPKHQSLQTTTYLNQIDREHPKPRPRAMVGVIIPKPPQFWFLKLEGAEEAVAAREADVRQFLKSLKFPDPETMTWDLPSGWVALPAREMRYATIVLNGPTPLEMSVTKLPLHPDKPQNDQILENVNRWRKQLSLRPIEIGDLEAKTEKLDLNDLTAYWVSLVGMQVPGAAPMGPMHPPVSRQPTSSKPAASKPAAANPPEQTTLDFTKPAEWSEGPPVTFAKLSLQALDGDAKVAITVTQAGGNRLFNVNRWRKQVGLEPFDEAQIATASKKVDVGSLSGDLYEIKNNDRTILGVIVADQDQSWFVKLDGNSALAERERPRFDAFLKSLKLQ